jgi:hypothetical protein
MQVSRAGNASIVGSSLMQDLVRSMIASFVSCEIIVETANWIYPRAVRKNGIFITGSIF